MIGPSSTPSPSALQTDAEVVENVLLARNTYRIRLATPEMARAIVPGQFIMLRLLGRNDPLLARPFALYDTVLDSSDKPVAIDVVYLVIGRVTGLMAELRHGDRVMLWGPLGNGFTPADGRPRWMVAGGIGQTPFLALARESMGLRAYGHPARGVRATRDVSLCYGVRSADLLAGVEDFKSLGIEVHVITDDGSSGRKGFVTDLVNGQLSEASKPARIACCGPEPMMAAVARLAAEHQIPCELSLETPMACGIGACFSCVTRVKTGDETDDWDYRRVCIDGPVFDAARVIL